jgi:hypothetical protein
LSLTLDLLLLLLVIVLAIFPYYCRLLQLMACACYGIVSAFNLPLLLLSSPMRYQVEKMARQFGVRFQVVVLQLATLFCFTLNMLLLLLLVAGYCSCMCATLRLLLLLLGVLR